MQNALRERYALLPYIYTLFRAANETGEPIMRPMFYEFPQEPSMLAVEHQLMLGPAILAAPVLDSGTTHVDMHLPSGEVFYNPSGEKIVRPPSGVYSYAVSMDTIPRYAPEPSRAR
jgi:mannosyl-oligosaccharide alpha-1,3-glucosidase